MSLGGRSSELPQLTANANNIPDADNIDCGIRLLGWCRGPNCTKHARLRTFVAVLAYAAVLQGACETYFRISAKQSAYDSGQDALIVEWLIVSSSIFQSIFALAVAYWAHKLHPTSWLGGATMLQAVTGVIAVIPSIMTYSDDHVSSPSILGSNLCNASQSQQTSQRSLTPEQTNTLTLVLMFFLQLAIGLGSLAFYVIGIIYVDDNSESLDSPAVIAAILTAKLFGLQVGSLLVLAIEDTVIGWWLGWVILAPLIFAAGFLLSLFPKRLPKTIIHQAAQRIIEETRQLGNQISSYIDDPDFMPTMKRLFSNKLLMFNIVSMMFIEGASVNYTLQQESYLQSRFFLPVDEQDGLSQEWQARLISYFLKPPVAAITMLVGGLIISKIKPNARVIAGINIVQGFALAGIYVGYIFINCNVGPIAGISGGKLSQPFCSKQCVCKPTSFLPVCPENTSVTYFSPCYAGCDSLTTINNVMFYEGCTCDSSYGTSSWTNVRATVGACSAAACLSMLIVFQVLSVLSAGIMGMVTIGKLMILLRSVLPQDKAMALAMEMMIVGLFTYVPVNLSYALVTRVTCLYWAPNYSRCLLRENPKHGNILNILSASLILVGVVFDLFVYYYAKDLNLYHCKVTDENYTPSLYSPMPRDNRDEPSFQSPVSSNSPITSTTTVSPNQLRSAPIKNEITVFRNPSSVTSSSAGEGSIVEPNGNVQYAQIVFPPDRRKPDDGTTSPKRMAVRADVPLHHLSAHDVRSQLNNLKSFNAETKTYDDRTETETTPLLDANAKNEQPPLPPPTTATTTTATGAANTTTTTTTTTNTSTGAKPKTPTRPAPTETDFDLVVRPTSPETDF